MPRELSAGAVQPLTSGLHITCSTPCAPEDSFAIEDLKSWFATQGVAVSANSPVNILVTRYGTAIARSIYSEAAAKTGTASEMPNEMRPEGYAIIPDGKGLALTAATDAGIFYALQTVKQLVTGYAQTLFCTLLRFATGPP